VNTLAAVIMWIAGATAPAIPAALPTYQYECFTDAECEAECEARGEKHCDDMMYREED
jgi:hypothetical protein